MPESSPALPPRFSLISPVYNVERYLEEFIASVEAQDFPLERVELVMVDDGSTDSSSRILAEWQARRPDLVTVVSKPNGGISSARNLGLDTARGEWVSFPDPDDVLTPGYLTEVDGFIGQHPTACLVATRRRIYLEASDRMVPHALDSHFVPGNRLCDLDEDSDLFHGAANTAFVRREQVLEQGTRFDERVSANFEDGHWCASHLLRQERPLVGFVATAEYRYRKRALQDSSLNLSRAKPERYDDVLEHGYVDVLRRAKLSQGRVPEWLQSFVLYELSWYFQDEDAASRAPTAAIGQVAEACHRHLATIVSLLDPAVIASFQLRPLKSVWRDTLLHGYDPHPWHSPYALVSKLDRRRQLVRVSYRHTHARPSELFLSDGVAVAPTYEKTRGVTYFDRIVLHERILWLPAGSIRVKLDGVDTEVRTREPELPRYSLPLTAIRWAYVPRLVRRNREGARAAARRQPLSVAERLVLRLSRTTLVRRYFGRAWVLIDRVESADDNAELLFRHLREHRRGKNAWFVIRRGTPDHRRLVKDGYKRVVPYGSLRWKLLMLHCSHLVSSQADVAVHQPPEILRLGAPGWRFTYLPHGVVKDDASRWLNPKDLDLLVTSTRAEHDSVVAEGSPYRYGRAETRLTGLPRFDALLGAGRAVEARDRDLVLLSPTWRTWLRTDLPGGGQGPLSVEDFVRSDFAVNWWGLMGSGALAELAEVHGLRIGLLLHPHLQPLTGRLPLPAHVQPLQLGGHALRDGVAHARVLVTDYSSTAFDAAYVDRPVVYFQFDRERVFSGEHVGRPGYFDYERDGFGPVATSREEAVAAIRATVLAGPQPQHPYSDRIAETFPVRDGRCTERVFEAIRDSSRRVPRDVPRLLPAQRTGPGYGPVETGDAQTVERSRPSQ